MSQPKPYLSLYTYDQNKQEITHLSVNDKEQITVEGYEIWESLLPIIKEKADAKELIINFNEPDLQEPQIILLFLKSEHIANGIHFFDVLANGGRKKEVLKDRIIRFIARQIKKRKRPNDNQAEGNENDKLWKKLRPNIRPEERLKQSDSITIFHPIITICYTDITTLSSEEKDEAGEHELEWNKLIYNTFQHDARVKFLDSSIWHRYVPVYPFGSTFDKVFQKVLGEVLEYHEQGLYYTNAANVTLEFQMRMLANSFIAEISDRDHDKTVTPFKFHSETWMRSKAKQIQSFFEGKHGCEQALKNLLKWQLLIVDDKADNPISSKEGVCEISKMKLIKNLLGDFGFCYADNIMIDHTEGEVAIVVKGLKKLKEKTYDIILLDYLLGDKNNSDRDREYGYELILELKEQKQNLQKGPLGRFWIVPISSFPYAFADKLVQLGLSPLTNDWHISHGGDPISTPYLFMYNLLNFFKNQVSESYLYPEEMQRLIQRFDYLEDHSKWAKAIRRSIQAVEMRIELLRDERSVFGTSLDDAIPVAYRDMIEGLLDILKKVREWDFQTHRLHEFEDIWNDKIKLLEDFESVFSNILYINIKKFIYKYKYDFERKIENHTSESILDFSRSFIEDIPSSIQKCLKARDIDFSFNKIRSLPKEMEALRNLRTLDLSNNSLEKFPDVLEKLNLSYLNLKDNPITKLFADIAEANSKEKVNRLIQRIKHYSTITEKIRRFIQNHNLEEALECFDQYASENGFTKLRDSATLLKSRYTRATEQKDKSGDTENYNIQVNQISGSLLSIINSHNLD